MISRISLEIRRRKGLRQCRRWRYEERWITPRAIGKYGTTPVPCSCFMCGNPRRNFSGENKLTMQELRIRQNDEEFYEDFSIPVAD
ncbi:MAG: hypothetical protein LBR31_07915 [Desulfovibrio sp.]|nr:hypothetical protein [Desulfovibrio sp.]